MNYKDKVIVITGATGGVGRATAHAFAREGAKIALLARGQAQLEGTKAEVEKLGGTALMIPTDVADPAQVEAAAEQTEKELGPIDVWVNNAMNSVFGKLKEIKPEDFKRVTDVTYLGQVYGAMSALRRMNQRNRGSIIFVGSALAYRGIPLQSAYCGSKHGIQGFYDSLRCELMSENSNIKTCMVQLPAMDTTQFGWVMNLLPNKPRPMGKIYTPDVAARGILYAAAHNKREIYIGFPTYKAIIGNKIADWYADIVLAKTGIDGQQTSEPKSPDRVNNLWEPVPEDRGTYGGFANKSHDFSLTLWLVMHGISPVALLLVMIIAALGMGVWALVAFA